MMSRILLAAAALLVAAPPSFADDGISLVGTWTGQRERNRQGEEWREGPATLVIASQKGRTFTGELIRGNPGGDQKEPLWGAFTPGGGLIVAADEEGTYHFELIDANTLDWCYVESKPSAAAVCARMTRTP